MAGIGFRLQHLLNRGSYGGLIQAYIYSAIISSGPWMLSILGLALIGVVIEPWAARQDLVAFRCIVVHVYALSLLLTGAIQLGSTRYLADRLFIGDTAALVPCYHWLGIVTLLGSGVLGTLGAWLAGLDVKTTIPTVVLLQAVSLTWMGMLFLSAAKDYIAIAALFAIGHGLSVGACLAGAIHGGMTGMLWGFTCGQVVLVALIGVRIRAEFPGENTPDGRVIGHWLKLPWLMVVGLAFNLGLWADKLVFWNGPGSIEVLGALRMAPRYDACMFIAYLSVVPAMALFLIRIEVAFYKHYSAFYAAITQGADLATIMEAKRNMVAALRLSAIRLFKLQGTCSAALILLTPQLVNHLGMTEDHISTLRLAFAGAFAQALLQIVMVLLLYFEWQKDAAIMGIIFLVANAGLSWLTVWGAERLHGLGYLSACLIALLFGLMVLNRRVANLEYETFVKQPIKG